MVRNNVNGAGPLDAYIASGFVRPDRGRTRRRKHAHVNADGFSKENHNRGNDVMADYSSSDDDDTTRTMTKTTELLRLTATTTNLVG